MKGCMYPQILHLYGPVWIYGYGLMIVMGFLLFLYATINHPIRKFLMSADTYFTMLFVGLLGGVIGGRGLFVLTNWHHFSRTPWEMFYPWVGGFMISGSIIGITLLLPWYLWYKYVSIIPALDFVSVYAPLMQSIARIGCLLAGCCYGAPSSLSLPWAVYFTHPAGSAPLFIHLHPTQLYASAASFIIFLILKSFTRYKKLKNGMLTVSYLLLENLARFTVDFWRGDRAELITVNFFDFTFRLSEPQLITVGFSALVFIIAPFILRHGRLSPFTTLAKQND